MKNKKKNDYTQRLRSLVDIGVALSSEKDLNSLLSLLLQKALEVTGAEGASIYLTREESLEDKDNVISLQKTSVLYFLKSINRIRGLFDQSGTLPIDSNSIAGYTALSRKVVNIADCYHLPEDLPFTFNKSYDQKTDYRTKSMLAVPMISADGSLRGVLQVINKLSPKGLDHIESHKKLPVRNIQKFTAEDEELMQVYASYAAISLENSILTENIENLFESFVRASVKAIEARDPTTSGHSDRVAMMTVELALATHKVGEGPYKNVIFTEEQLKEIRYASLLHDFGKIGVSETVLLKKKKLPDRTLESILLRFDTMGHQEEASLWKNLCEKLMEDQKNQLGRFDVDMAYQNVVGQIDGLKDRIRWMRSNVIMANEPQVISEDFDIDKIVERLGKANEFFNNSVLSQSELKTLSIPQGSLSQEERNNIELHVSHTYEFLKQIAWTDNLRHVTQIAHCHHEKMDGSGYPRRIKGEAIPIQSRMMTIADIYDALTAFDRPYKEALPPSRALEILVREARKNKVDGYLLKIFIEAGIFTTLPQKNFKKAG